MSSPVPEFNFARPNPKRPLNLGNSPTTDLNVSSRFVDVRATHSPQVRKELERLQMYGLDISNDDNEALKALSDPNSPFFGTNKVRKLKNKALLPYKTETIRDQYKYLSFIIAHIYIAVKSLDLKGNLTISVEDFEAAKSAVLNNEGWDDFINSTFTFDGQKYETLHTNESETIEDDENEEDSDYYDSSEDEDEDAANSTPILKVEPESASIISLKYWTKELKNLLKMGLILPLDITKKLVKVFYAVTLSRGQSIDLSFYIETITLLTREKKLLKSNGLILDWRLVYEEFATTLGNPTTFGPSMKDTRFKKLVSLALSVKYYFDDDCVPLIMENIMERLSNQTVSSSLIHLLIMLPMNFKIPSTNIDDSVYYDKRDIRYYLPIFFDLWVNHKSDKEINCLVSLVMNIAVESLKKGADDNSILYRGNYGIFTKHQFKFIMNQLFLSSQIRHNDNKMIKYCKTISQIIISSLSAQFAFEDEGILDYLKTFVDSVYTMIHPSNIGPWSSILAEVVKKLANSLHLRVQGEKKDRDLVPLYHPNYTGLPDSMKLNDSIIESIVKMLLPLIHLGSQSKSSTQRRQYNQALQVLCFMKPQLVLDNLLLDWYSSFETVNSTHRIPIVINQLNQLARIIVEIPVYRVHIARFLSLLIPAIDSNDPEKTIITTDFITTVATIIPFADLTEGAGDGGVTSIDFTSQHIAYLEAKFYESSPASRQFGEQSIPDKFEYDPDYELLALKSATSSFKEFITQFAVSCFKFLEMAPAIESTQTIESQACALISYCFEALVDSTSDELYKCLADSFFEYVTNNVKHEVALVYCNIAECIIRRDPTHQFKQYMDFFMPHIFDEIEHGAGVSRSQDILSKDQRLIWYMRILSGAISGAGVEIVSYLPQIEKFILSNTYKLKGTAGICAAMIGNCALSTISYLRPLERRLVSPTWLEEHGGKYSEECWGGFQFSEKRFEMKYLDYKWYIPSQNEVDMISRTFENIASPSISAVNKLSKRIGDNDKLSLDELDQLGFHVELLEGLLKGVCCLFDQSYKEPIENKNLGKLKSSLGPTQLSSSPSLVNLAKSDSSSSIPDEIKMQKGHLSIQPSIDKISSTSNSSTESSEKKASDDEEMQDINPINREIEEKITKADSSSNLSILSDEIELEIPTRAATPGINDSIDAVDASLTKRSDILYTYGPYFPKDSFSKGMDPSYHRLHNTRDEIGKSLHNSMRTLLKKDGFIDLISKVIQCTSTWLNDCGYYSSDNELYTDNLHFISILEFPGVFAPYTRSVLGARLAVYHCSRINISCCTRLPSKLDKALIKDLVSLAASPYGITAAHATSALSISLNRVMNCTSLIFSIFDEWEEAIMNKDKEVLLSIMIMFDKKKLRGLVEKSATMLPRYEELLFRSAELNEEEITVMSMRLFKSIKKYIRIPAEACIIEEQLIECIRPPDLDVSLKISSLKLAKAKKKAQLKQVLSRLVNKSIQRLSKKLSWKFMLLVLELITSVQSHIEVPLEENVLEAMVKFVDGSHPEISKKGMFWIASIMDTVESRAFNNYDIKNMLSTRPFDPTIVSLKSMISESNAINFFKEIQNTEDPKFYIDNKLWIPMSPWHKDINVVRKFDRKDYNLNISDKLSVQKFAECISKDWLLILLKNHIDESESTTAFFPGIVYFFTSIATLIIFGYVKNLSLSDLFEITDEIYKGEERPTHVAVSEVFCGILFACKHDSQSMSIADIEISKRIERIFDQDLTQSTYKMWSIFSWWLSSHFDVRRTPNILNLICDFEVNSDRKKSPFGLLCRITFLRSYLGSTMNRFHKFDEVTHRMFSILGHPYDTISSEVSSVLFDILFYRSTATFETFDEYMDAVHMDKTGMGLVRTQRNELFHSHLQKYFKTTLMLAAENEGKTPQEVVSSDFMFHVKGLNSLLVKILKTSINIELVDYIVPYILPLTLQLDKVKDACNLADISIDTLFLILGSIRYKEEDHDQIIKLIETNMGWKSPKLTQYKHILAFFGVYGTVRFLERSVDQRKKLMEITVDMLFSPHLYLREQYSQNLKLFIHLFLDSEREQVIKHYIKKFKKIIKKNKLSKEIKLTYEQTNQVHGATLGLCALVEAYPYTTPPPKWLPEILSILEVKCASYGGIIGRTVKNTLAQFKKTRQDTWHIDSKFFTEEQLEDLEGVLYKSYYI